MPFKLAVDERLLSGDTDVARVEQAVGLGIGGIEYQADGLTERVQAINAVLKDHPVQASTVHLGTRYNMLAADEPTRQMALDQLRFAMTNAVDIGAEGVVIVPHIGAELGLPDLMPYKAPIQLAVELMVWHLRSLSDLAYVFGINLYMHPLNHYETAFLNRLDQGVELRRRIKFHEHVLLAADCYHMTFGEENPFIALRNNREHIGHVYLVETNGTLPRGVSTMFESVSGLLFDKPGWAVMTHYSVSQQPTIQDLKFSVEYLKKSGF